MLGRLLASHSNSGFPAQVCGVLMLQLNPTSFDLRDREHWLVGKARAPIFLVATLELYQPCEFVNTVQFYPKSRDLKIKATHGAKLIRFEWNPLRWRRDLSR